MSTAIAARAARSPRGMVLSAVLILAALAIPLFANGYALEVLSEAWFYVLLCLGLNIVVGFAGLLDLGYAAFFAVGAYTAGLVTLKLGLSFWFSLPLAVIAASIAGVIIGGPTLRLRSDYLAIVTLGFGEMVRIAVRNLAVTGGASGLVGISRPYLFGYKLDTIGSYYYIFLALALLAVAASHRLENSRIGRAWKYVRSDEDAARAMGINHAAVKLSAYMLGAIFASIGGCFYAAKMTAIAPETFNFNQSLLILLGVVLGGRGKIPGVMLGAIVVVVAPEVFRDIGSMRMLVFALSLLLIMLLRPAGIWPERWRWG
ncbi:MAG: branched-chain amino acid ABC transporter permease [Rhodospirillales bacterium]|nr:branched-chain amino acid ABC transporter permease [Rhodospirillales bacterium]